MSVEAGAIAEEDAGAIVSDDDGAIGAADDEAGAASEDDEETTTALEDELTVVVVGVPRLKIQMRPMMTITATMMMIQVLRFIGKTLRWRSLDREECCRSCLTLGRFPE